MACFSAENEAEAGIEELQCFAPLEGFLGVVFWGHLLYLPWAPDLITQSPVFDIIRFFMTVLPPEVCVIGIPRPIAILHPSQCFIKRPSSKVQTEVRLYPLFSPLTQYT